MDRIIEIEQRLAQIGQEIETRGDALTAEEITDFETEVNDLQEERTRIADAEDQRSRVLDKIAKGTQGTPGQKVIRKFTKPQEPEDEDMYGTLAYRKAFMNFVRRGQAVPVEYRADTNNTTTEVSAVIPTTVMNVVIQKLEVTGHILSRVTKTNYKGGVSIPKNTIKPTATWTTEGASSDTQAMTTKTTDMITFSYFKLRCAVKRSIEVENMSLSAFEAAIIKTIVEAMTKALELAIISGTGTTQPKGITQETPVTDQVISTAAVTYSDLLAVEGALPEAYEGGAEWCMSKKTFMSLYGLVDDNGQPIGRVNYGMAGKPERFINGRSVVITEHMPAYSTSLTAGTVFAFIFDFSDYAINTNYEMTVKKYEDNETDDQVTKGLMIVDGKVVDTNSLVTLKKIASS